MTSALPAAAILLGTLALPACAPYRIEYRNRPAYYGKLSDAPLPDRVVMPDGTVIVYQTGVGPPGGPADAGADGDGESKVFRIREQAEDGTERLHALMPEHVVAATLACLRSEEYELLWDQMIAQETKDAYAANGKGFEEFAAFFRAHRIELAKLLNRMLLGFMTYETVAEGAGDGVVVCRLHPKAAELFRFKRVLVVHEGPGKGMKLLVIE
jgi:hypothetical protein